MSEPVWMKAFHAWYNKTYLDFVLSGAELNEAAAKAFAARMDWRMCSFCDGPCGDCKQKASDAPYSCDPCPRDQFGINECLYCPYYMFSRLFELRPEQSK